MRALDLDRRFDAALAWHSLFDLPHAGQRATPPRLAAHLAPGAALMFTAGPAHAVSIGEWRGEPLFHASLSPNGHADLLDRADRPIEQVRDDGRDGVGTVYLARRRG